MDQSLFYSLIGPVIGIIAGILGIAFGAYKAGQLSSLNGVKETVRALNGRLDYLDERIQSFCERVDRLLEKSR